VLCEVKARSIRSIDAPRPTLPRRLYLAARWAVRLVVAAPVTATAEAVSAAAKTTAAEAAPTKTTAAEAMTATAEATVKPARAPAEATVATDPLSGRVLKIEAVLTVLK